MPAYFSITFELSKRPNVIRDFCDSMNESGLSFLRGYWASENDSLSEIISWNQNKLDEDFVLGRSEHYTHNYKQMLLSYSDFSEVRLFIINKKSKPTFSFELIVPEDDLINYSKEQDGSYSRKLMDRRMTELKDLAQKMWSSLDILIIQTGWELSECASNYEDISLNNKPQAEPFAIIPEKIYQREWGMSVQGVNREGMLIESDES